MGTPIISVLKFSNWLSDFNISVESVKDLSVANLMLKLASENK